MALPVNLYEVVPRWMPLARYHMPLPECRCRNAGMPDGGGEGGGRSGGGVDRRSLSKKYRQVDHTFYEFKTFHRLFGPFLDIS